MSSVINVVIGIPTVGRREQLALTLAQIGRQRRAPNRVLICPAQESDYDPACAELARCPVQVVESPQGSSVQRNAILRAGTDADIVIFFDDDFYPAPDYVEAAIDLFAGNSDLVIATNQPIVDGAHGPGVEHEQALKILADDAHKPPQPPFVTPTYGGYGCNMAVRVSTVRVQGVWFDENLPLYAWLEDIDFSRRLAPHGRIVTCSRLRGVHLGTKCGRTSDVRLGYSQVANPVYMVEKGSLDVWYALKQMARNVTKNVIRSLRPEPWIDRRGRLVGNAIALSHLVTGDLRPERVLSL